MTCPFCEAVERRDGLLYENADVAVIMKEEAVTLGQVTIFPKKHLTIMELLDDGLLQKCTDVANKAGIAVFEALGVQGTNVLVQNGLGAGQNIPHFSIEIIPRKQDDGLALSWQPKEMDDIELGTTLSLLQEEWQKPVVEEKLETVEAAMPEASSVGLVDNQLLKNLRRIP